MRTLALLLLALPAFAQEEDLNAGLSPADEMRYWEKREALEESERLGYDDSNLVCREIRADLVICRRPEKAIGPEVSAVTPK